MPAEEIEGWKNVQRVLKPLKVQIPYAEWLAENIPTNKVRIRRDFERVLLAVSPCALLHQYQRECVMRDGQEHVIASIADYFIVRELLEGSLIETVKGTSRKTEILVKEVVAIQREKEKNTRNEDIDIHCDVKTSEVLERTRSSRSSVYKWLQPAIEAGLIEKEPRRQEGALPGNGEGHGRSCWSYELIPSRSREDTKCLP